MTAEMQDAIARALTERDELNDRITAALALHEDNKRGFCSDCLDGWGNPVLYPCETARVLGVRS